MKQETYARVYRFHNSVALNTESSTETAYLSPAMARELAGLLVKYADNIGAYSFADCELGTYYAGRRDIDDAREIGAARLAEDVKAALDAEAAGLERCICGHKPGLTLGHADHCRSDGAMAERLGRGR